MASPRNAEGYVDPTAYLALRNIENQERRNRRVKIRRGDIFYIKNAQTIGSEQRGNRPAIVVSNNKSNESSSTVEVVYLTTQPKRDLPTHVTIESLHRESTAICEQISTVALERVGEYKGRVTDVEMTKLEMAMLISLDLYLEQPKPEVIEKVVEKPVEVIKEVRVPGEQDPELLKRLAEAEAMCAMLQRMYDGLLNRVVRTD